VALVIGNGEYRHGNPLVNPQRDAEDVAGALRQCGFDLVGGGAQTNLTHEAMEKQVESFAAAASTAKVVLFFFAGHGLEVDGGNYMVPVDAQIEEKYQVKHRTLALDQILGAMDGEERLKIVILDCCRNNPLGRGWGRDNVAGLGAPKSTPGGTILLFAAAPGQVAADGRGRNSPFTGVLKEALLKPGDEIEKVFKQVGAQVKAVTGKQQPWMNSSFYGTFAFVPGVTPVGSSGGTGEMVKLPSVSPPPPITLVPTVSDLVVDEASAGKIIQITLPGEILMKFCFCPDGSFMVGGLKIEGQGISVAHSLFNEPVNVRISQGFWLGQTEVTQAQWAAFMGSNPSMFSGNNLPVDQVSWSDAQAFVAKLNKGVVLPVGWKFALPTEAQWEYACRAGTKSAFSFGNTLTSQQANFDGNSPYGSVQKGSKLGKTANVGSYAANPWGIQDMHGNVQEWCADWLDDGSDAAFYWRYANPDLQRIDPVGHPTGVHRVIRGGSWYSPAADCHAAARFGATPDTHNMFTGFRIALVRSK
jgi:formylglycine-generating enzyme required for sulfatase activity